MDRTARRQQHPQPNAEQHPQSEQHPYPEPRARRPRRAAVVLAGMMVLLVAGCGDGAQEPAAEAGDTSVDVPAADQAGGPNQPDPDAVGPDALGAFELDLADVRAGEPVAEAVIDGGELSLVGTDGERRTVLTVGGQDGELVHAAVRPGSAEPVVVLTVFRVTEPDVDPRYELRYVVVADEGLSELSYLPWRMQIDARIAEVVDVAPAPVWSPDGSAFAWVEWNAEGSKLRLQGWHEADAMPSEVAASYRLGDIDPGTRLDTWEAGDTTVFTGRGPDGEPLEIELDLRRLAMPPGDA